jgi:hypothetical protein
MTELARSVDTGEILNAKVAWERSCKTEDFTGASMFMCLDMDHCGIQLTLTKYGDENAKRKFFTPHKRGGHSQECVMEHGTEREKEEFHKNLNPDASPEEIRQILEFGNKNIVVREPIARNNDKPNISTTSKEKSEKEQEEAVSQYNKLRNKNLTDSAITTVGSLYSYYLDNPDTPIKDISWYFKDKNGKQMGNSSFIKQNFSVKDIFCEIKKDTFLEWRKGMIFTGKIWVNSIQESHGHDTVIKFIDQPDINICWFNSDELKGVPNVALFRRARELHFPINICIAGYFYKDKSDKIKFKMRTNDVKDCLFIPDEERKN